VPASLLERAYLGLGSNLDDPGRQLDRALEALDSVIGLRRIQVSAYYRTAPWGNRDQPDFVNAVLAVDCAQAPADLLDSMLSVERNLGRRRDGARWAPRTIDLDLLYFGTRSLATSQLDLPHPRIAERAFVLVPLLEVATVLADPRRFEWQHMLSKLPHDDVVRLQPDFGSKASA
jgi:2-amino-4-hydroxy-6-hydroxymethyldihydropteridine diphosphokinase